MTPQEFINKNLKYSDEAMKERVLNALDVLYIYYGSIPEITKALEDFFPIADDVYNLLHQNNVDKSE